MTTRGRSHFQHDRSPRYNNSNNDSVEPDSRRNYNDRFSHGDSPRCPVEPCNKIFVTHFPPNFESNDLNDLFSKFGRITSTKLVRSGDKRYGFVAFSSIEEATNAISGMHQQPPHNYVVNYANNRFRDNDANSTSNEEDNGNNAPQRRRTKSSTRHQNKEIRYENEESVTKTDSLCTFCGMSANNKCSSCGVKYCSKKCQDLDWGVHMTRCLSKPYLVPDCTQDITPGKGNFNKVNRLRLNASYSHFESAASFASNREQSVSELIREITAEYKQSKSAVGNNEQEDSVVNQQSVKQKDIIKKEQQKEAYKKSSIQETPVKRQINEQTPKTNIPKNPNTNEHSPKIRTPVNPHINENPPKTSTPVNSHTNEPAPKTSTPINSHINESSPKTRTPINSHINENIPKTSTPINSHINEQTPKTSTPVNSHINENSPKRDTPVNPHTTKTITPINPNINEHAPKTNTPLNSHISEPAPINEQSPKTNTVTSQNIEPKITEQAPKSMSSLQSLLLKLKKPKTPPVVLQPWQKVEILPKDSFTQVSVVHVYEESPIFFGTLAEKENISIRILTMANDADLEQKPLTSVNVGSLCLVIVEEVIYRAIIQTISPITVKLLDFGYTVTATESQILEAPPTFAEDPAQAICMRLKPGNADKISINLFDTLDVKPTGEIMDGAVIVVLQDEKYSDTSNNGAINKNVSVLQNSQSDTETIINSNAWRNSLVMPDVYTEVTITWITDNEIYVSLVSNEQFVLDQLFHANQNKKKMPLEEIGVGKLCVVPYEDIYYRAVIRSVEPITAYLLDYGNLLTVDKNTICSAVQLLTKTEPQAIHVRLAPGSRKMSTLRVDDCVVMRAVNKVGDVFIVQIEGDDIDISASNIPTQKLDPRKK